jgi:WD40 repeat protein
VGLAFTRTGEYLASASWDGTTRFWHTDTHRQVLSLPESGNVLSLSADDRRLSFQTWDHRQVRLFELANWTIAQRITLPPPRQQPVHHTGQAVFSPDGELVLVPDHDGVYVYQPPKPVPLALVPVADAAVCFAADGSALFTGGADGAQRWPMTWSADRSELRLGAPERLEPTRGLPVSWVELSHDGRWLVAQAKHTVVTLRTDAPFERARFEQSLRLSRPPRISPDGRWVATVTPALDRIQIWNGRTGRVETNLAIPGTWQCAFSPDGRWLAFSQQDSTAALETANWSLSWRFSHPSENVRRPLAFSPDGRILAVFVSEQAVQFLRSDTGEAMASLPAGRMTTGLCFSPKGDRLAVGSEPGYFHLWDLRQVREQLATLHLDWDLPPYPPEPLARTSPLRVIVHTDAAAPSHRDNGE